MGIAIHWFRRDLRLTDNTALAAAVARHDQVIPVYIASEWRGEHRWCGAPRQEFLCGSLAELAKHLRAKGGRLIIRQGRAEEMLIRLARETGAEDIYFNRDPDPFGRALEQRIETMAGKLGVTIHSHQDIAIFERDAVLTGSGSPFKVFTPYARAWRKIEGATRQKSFRSIARFITPPQIASDPLPTLSTWGLASDAEIITPGETAARRRLGRFLDGPIFSYARARDFAAEEGTSRLSQDFRHGTLSIREVHAQCAALEEKTAPAQRRHVAIFINELIWRDFYMQVLWHWPEVLETEWKEQYRRLKWRDYHRPEKRAGGHDFQRWCRGETGFPLIDAGLRQLASTGFMHNRLRMITAMFLTKDLHVWWMHGESWFMRHLVDGEIASNNGGWQWSASTGTDAAPYFRIQNPWSQTKRFDPEGAYIKRWVPELRDVAAAKFCAPPEDGAPLAKGYPRPMVDHARERDTALEMFRLPARAPVS